MTGAARAIRFTALCEGVVLDDVDLAGRVKDPLAAMPESSAWPILSKAATMTRPACGRSSAAAVGEEPPRDPLLILEDCFA
jgi:hypothetical protein